MTDIPTRLVDAAARAIRDHWCSIYDARGGGWYWRCQCESGRSVTAPALWEVCAQEVGAHQANAAVAAVFAECEVEVLRAYRGEDEDGPWLDYVSDYSPPRQGGELCTRLEITTPWEDTDG